MDPDNPTLRYENQTVEIQKRIELGKEKNGQK